ncbi:MAG: glycosyltransferase family 2 protein [Draconibacterium sp.]
MSTLSVITIAYNCAPDLEATIQSVTGQIFNDIEYIVVDGGSNDGSPEVIKKYEAGITKWVSELDKGIYDAMNKGLKMASGEYVLFMNAGDTFYKPETLAKIPFDAYPNADVFYGETLIVNHRQKVLGLRHKKLPHRLNWKHFRRGMVVCHQSILVRRTLAPMYNPDYKLSADVEWVLQSLKASKQIVFTNSIIARFLEGGASIKQHNESLKERFVIMRKYFGLPVTLFSHFVFVLDALLIKLGLKSYYRKNYLE